MVDGTVVAPDLGSAALRPPRPGVALTAAMERQLLQRQQREPSRLRDVLAFVLEHLDEPLSVDQLARALGMSTRTLTRWSAQELGESPAALVRRVRLEEAQRLLEQTALPLKDIARRTLIGDASTVWRVFKRRLGITPAEYRTRFSARPATRPSARTFQ